MARLSTSTNRDWDLLRKHFPVTENYIYFNHAAIAPISLPLKKQVYECMENYCENGIVCNRDFLSVSDQTRELAARLINANGSQIAFIKNTTQGIQVAANGIRWQPGDNVLIPENEFPANVYPWLNLAKRGVETRFIPLRDGRFTVEDISRYSDERTRAVTVSAVSFTNGFRCNLTDIGTFCRDRGIFFIVDAIQALGAVGVDVLQSRIDLLSADAHKWLLGPQGIGFIYVSDSILESLTVANLGYKSMTEENDYLNYNIRLKPDASRFEEGTLNIFGIVGMKASLEMLLSIGIHAVEVRISELIGLLSQNLIDRGYLIKSSLYNSEQSGILSFKHKSIETEKICKKLFDAKVVCAQRDNAIRVSPHFYNNMNDITHFLNALPY